MQLEKKMKLKEQPKQIVKKSDIIKSKKYLFKMIIFDKNKFKQKQTIHTNFFNLLFNLFFIKIIN